ncbi:MAG: M90 family metallopeptidase [Campylobacterota bacterium]|nr:M90 family metallopeptidase [Campylobacterota bacterium]
MDDVYIVLFKLFGSILILWILWLFYQSRKRKQLIEKINVMPFPDPYRDTLHKIPHYGRLPENDQKKIERNILYFLESKEFIGNHMEISDEIRVTIAFYACLLLLHLDHLNSYGNLKRIIVYPNAMVTEQVRGSSGIYSKEEMVLSGQSANDTVVISWHDAKREAYHLRYENVIIHEFAHEIDYMDGEIDGTPPMMLSHYYEWSEVMYDEFSKLTNAAVGKEDWGKYKMIGSYAATNEAEFFAVITERFYEAPSVFKRYFPDLYKELQSFYRIDPIIFELPKTV